MGECATLPVLSKLDFSPVPLFPPCWVHVGNLDEFTGKKKEEFCTSSKQTIETAFNVYTGLLSQDPDSLKVFEDVVTA